jgi:putative ABC transport system permease protein
VGLKDSGARPLRAWLTVLTLAVTVVAIVTTLGLDRTVSGVSRNPAEVGDPYDLAVDPGATPRPVIEDALDQPQVGAWFTATDRRGAVGDQTFHVRALGGDVAHSGYVVREGRMIRGPGEAILGYGLLKKLGLEVGDRLPLEVSGGTLDLRVVGRYSESEDSGQIAQISLADLRQVEPDADAGDYLVRLAPNGSAQAVQKAVLAASRDEAKIAVVDTSTDDLNSFRAAFYLISLLVLTVGFVNLLGTTLLGIRERTRDLGILKTIGFTPRQVAASVATGDAALALAAVVVGVPAGLVISARMQDAINRASGIGPGFGSGATVPALMVTAVLIVAIAAALGGAAARRAASAPVADIVRAE